MRETANEKQRFSIRKLTIGAASVLLGTFLFWGGTSTVKADQPKSASQQPTSSVVDSSKPTENKNSTTSKDKQEKVTGNSTGQNITVQTDSTIQKTNPINTPSAKVKPVTAKSQVSSGNNADSKDSTKETKSGNSNTFTVSTGKFYKEGINGLSQEKIEKNKATLSGYFHTDGLKSTYNVGDQQKFVYQLSTYGNSDVSNPRFIIKLPKGFTTNTLTIDSNSQSNSDKNPTITNLGFDTDGEQIFEITTNGTPDWNGKKLVLDADATAGDTGAGTKQTYSLWNQLVFGNQDDINENGDNSIGGGTQTINLQNGTNINAVKYYGGIGNVQNGTFSYTIIPGKNQIEDSSYQIKNVNAKAVDSTDNTTSGSEKLDFDIYLNNPIKDQDYIDVDMGLNTANGTILHYDNTLAPNMNITYKGDVIGKAYNMGSYYRVIFNSNTTNKYINTADPSNPFIVHLSLNWASGETKARLNNTDKGPLLYQYTSDDNQNLKSFIYKAKNDIKIGDKTYSSNLSVPGEYISNNPYMNYNQQSNITQNQCYVRTWDHQGNVTVNTGWQNFNMFAPSTQNGNDFDVTVTVGKNKDLNYSWQSTDSLKKDLLSKLAKEHKSQLSNSLKDNSTLFVNKDTKDLSQIKSEISVTIDNKDTNNDYVRVYHIRCSNPDVKFEAFSNISLVNVSSPNFTMPTNISSYEQDMKARKYSGHYGFWDGAALTSNETLRQDLYNTDPISYEIDKINKDGSKSYVNNGTYNWSAWIGLSSTPLSVNNSSKASELRTVLLHFRDIANPTVDLTPQPYAVQGGTGNTIPAFPQANDELNTLETNDDYVLDHVVSVKNGIETTIAAPTGSDWNNLDKYSWGKFSNDNASQFIVYVKKAQVSFNIHYIDVGRTDKTSGFTPSDGTEVDNGSHDVKNIGGALNTNYDVTKNLWSSKDYEAEGYVLAEEPTNVGKGTFTSSMSDQYIYLKHKITDQVNDSKTVTETIKYKYQNGVEAFPTHTTSIQFKATSGKHDVHDNVDYDLVWTPTSSQFTQVVIPTINNYSFTASNDNDPDQDVIVTNGSASYIKSFSNIEHNSNDINLTVVYNIISEKAHLVFYDDSTDQFISKSNGIYSETSDPSNAYEDSTVDNSTAGENISFGAASSVLATLLGNNYKYEYVGISKENQNNISKVTAKTKVDKKTAFKDYKFGKLDNDENTDQYFIVHLKKTNSKPVSQTTTVKETIKFVDENNNSIHDPVTNGTITFTQTNGNWDKESDSFKPYLIPTTIGNYVFDHTLAAKTSDGKSLASVTVTHSSKDIVLTLVYKLKSSDHQKTTPPTPDNPQPNKTQPTAQTQPTSPTQPTQNSQDKTPKTPKKPTTPKKPAKPGKNNKPQTHKNHHKNPWNHNNGVHGENTPNGRRRNNWNQNYGPHSEYGYNGNYRPQGQNGYYGNSYVNGENVTNSSVLGENASAANSNSKKQATLPQTGEKQTNYGLIGLAFAAIAGLFALAGGEHKRRHN